MSDEKRQPTTEQRAAAERRRKMKTEGFDAAYGHFKDPDRLAGDDEYALAEFALQHLDASRDDGAAVDDLYYLQNLQAGYVGNNPLWWKQGGNGYTSYIDLAHKFTKDETFAMLTEDSRKWQAWSVAEVQQATYRTVEGQVLRRMKPANLAGA